MRALARYGVVGGMPMEDGNAAVIGNGTERNGAWVLGRIHTAAIYLGEDVIDRC